MNLKQRSSVLSATQQLEGKNVVVDAGPLLLLVIGSANRDDLSRHSRLENYPDPFEAFDILVNVLSRANHLIIIPHVVAEVNSLVEYKHHGAARAREFLGELVCQNPDASRNSCMATRLSSFSRLGFTDALLLVTTKRKGKNRALLTTDAGLYREALAHQIDAVNFNHCIDPD